MKVVGLKIVAKIIWEVQLSPGDQCGGQDCGYCRVHSAFDRYLIPALKAASTIIFWNKDLSAVGSHCCQQQTSLNREAPPPNPETSTES